MTIPRRAVGGHSLPCGKRSPRVGVSGVRYRIETVNGQLAERYNIKRTWAKDLCHRIIRKILNQTVAIVLTARAGQRPSQFDAWAA